MLQSEAPDLLLNLLSNPHLWLQALGSDQNKEIADMEPGRLGVVSSVTWEELLHIESLRISSRRRR